MIKDAVYDFDSCPDRRGYGSLKWDKYQDESILPLWVADMDFVSAPEIRDALRRRIDHGVFGYTIPYASVVESVVQYLKREHDYSIQPEWLSWLPGMVPALNLCCRAYTKPDESIMTATPVYPPFLSAPQFADRRCIQVPLCVEDDRWTLDFEAMEKAVEPGTRLFILCSPHNPVGRVYTRDELIRLADFCERHDLILISDEIHCDLVFDPSARHVMTATLGKAVADRTITLMSPSKTYNQPGLACAYAIIENQALLRRFQHTLRGIITEVNTFGYVGCEAAYNHGEPWRQALLVYLKGNHDLIDEFVRERLPGISFRQMEATYLAWLDVRELGLKNPALHFEKHGVGLSDGTPFGGPGYLRLNFGCPRDRLTEALERMEQAVKA